MRVANSIPDDVAKADSLAHSFADIGLLHPITVLPDDKGYRLLVGFHRLAALRLLERDTIPARTVTANDREAELIELDENLLHNGMSYLAQSKQLLRKYQIMDELGLIRKPGRYELKVSDGTPLNPLVQFVKDTATELGLLTKPGRPETVVGRQQLNPLNPRISFAKDVAAEHDFRGSNPITVFWTDNKGWRLISGLHRYTAHKMLKRPTVACRQVTTSELEAELIEIDENLQHHGMSYLAQSKQLQRKYQILGELDLLTKRGGDTSMSKVADGSLCDSKVKFAKETASEQGFKATTPIHNRLRIANSVPDDVAQLLMPTTVANSRDQLLLLAKLRDHPADQRRAARLVVKAHERGQALPPLDAPTRPRVGTPLGRLATRCVAVATRPAPKPRATAMRRGLLRSALLVGSGILAGLLDALAQIKP